MNCLLKTLSDKQVERRLFGHGALDACGMTHGEADIALL